MPQVIGCDSGTEVMVCNMPANKGFKFLLWLMVVQGIVFNCLGVFSIAQSSVSFTQAGLKDNFHWLADDLTGRNSSELIDGSIVNLFKVSAEANSDFSAMAYGRPSPEEAKSVPGGVRLG
jgi:hypothetical protein